MSQIARVFHKRSHRDAVDREIVASINTLVTSDEHHAEVQTTTPGDMSLAEKMALWANKEHDANHENSERDDLFDGVSVDEDRALDQTAPWSYRDLLLGSPPYEWLMSTLRRELESSGACPESRIRNQILEGLPSGKISRHRQPQTHVVTFQIPWEVITRSNRGNPLSHAELHISNECAVHDFQPHATVKAYAQARWPSCGEQLLSAIDRLLAKNTALARNGLSSATRTCHKQFLIGTLLTLEKLWIQRHCQRGLWTEHCELRSRVCHTLLQSVVSS